MPPAQLPLIKLELVGTDVMQSICRISVYLRFLLPLCPLSIVTLCVRLRFRVRVLCDNENGG